MATKTTKKRMVWTDLCGKCSRYLMPSPMDRCDACLLSDYRDLLKNMDVDGDPQGMITAYEEESVIAALRRAESTKIVIEGETQG